MTTPSSDTSRRAFLKGAATTAAATALVSTTPTFAAATSNRNRVVVLGGGMGGLTAAHELAERGFAVTVVEPKAFGGKARSFGMPNTGTEGRRNLPGEHGFRFFPGFYKNIPDTLSRIPVAGNPNGALDHLVNATQELYCMPGGGRMWLPPKSEWPTGPLEAMENLLTGMGLAGKVPPNEIEYIVRKMQVYLTSCDARRRGEWEYVSWNEFSNSDNFSPEYQKIFGGGITKTLVAAKGSIASTRTIGLVAEAFIYTIIAHYDPWTRQQSGYGAADRLLDLPTNEAWIDPWIAHLADLGVEFVTGHRARQIVMNNGRVDEITLQPTDFNGEPVAGMPKSLVADWYVVAMPVEQAVKLLDADLLAADPSLSGLKRLTTDWMNGIQYFLNRRPNIELNGHTVYVDSPWALSSIDQAEFWPVSILDTYGDGTVKTAFSIDISEWFTPGVVFGKPAIDCTPQEIAIETWEQMKFALNTRDETVLSDDMIQTWYLDPAIHWPNSYDAQAANREPLLINSIGSADDRPEATSATIHNLFFAADFVRTDVDLATMEGANQAGRAAANAILQRSGSSATPVPIETLWQSPAMDPYYAEDELLYEAGLPNAFDTLPEDSII